MSRRTRSTTRATTFQAFVAEILPIIVGQENSWVSAADVASIQATCRDANEILTSATGDAGIWRALATREWPDVDNLIDNASSGDDLPVGIYSSYRELYIHYPRVWLTMEAAKIKASPKWTKMEHMGKYGTIECGKCGCNCGNSCGECPGIPIESKFRFDRKERLAYYESRADVPIGEGYQMSGGSMVVLNHFCEPCFERMLELDVRDLGSGEVISVDRDDYDKVEGKTLYDETTNYVINDEGIDPWKDGIGNCYYCDPFFREWGEGGYSWQKSNRVGTDDAMIVISNALIDPNCSHKHLNIAGLHFNETYSEKAYKALAYALSINTSLRTVTMADYERWGEYCCAYDEYMSPYEDESNGLFVKALKLNHSHNIYRMNYCCKAFGRGVEREIKALLKSRPVKAASKSKRKHQDTLA
ncbi:hypothetical protein QTG54_009598 [Skeletonema marinoi]|uniref:Uncharacterized protein n=1 Tax=Skeletonema marinoi TaxID=267567 RepID=A0AAD8Y526_9STRA|nr:hypothetical protein QTG54_009598 [Skeletonema marinoi]